MELTNPELKQKILNAPELPGCYIYRDRKGSVLYVGKALILHNRVKQYFDGTHDLGPRIEIMVKKINDVEFVITDSETEALILETNLIKKYRPKYNVLKKDDKNYQWLMFDMRESFPKPELVRERKLRHSKVVYYGPFNESMPLKRTLRLLRRIFPYRTCTRKIVEKKGVIKSSDPKPCLFYFLGLCPAPCAAFINKEGYGKNIKAIRKFFENQKETVIKDLREEMYLAAKNQDFESAAQIRDRMNDLISISQRIDVSYDTDEHKFRKIKSASKAAALNDLLEIIDDDRLELHDSFKMECYDISNIQGKHAVGSMVAFVNGFPAKRLYRKFKIQKLDTPNDFAMLKEVFSRRFKYVLTEKTKESDEKVDESFHKAPDLIIVDGGKGQLSSTYKVLTELGVNIPIVGLAKRYEDMFIPDMTKGELEFVKRTLPQGSEARYLMQRIRDEAHRFGITFHRQLRLKAQTFSVLSEIPGVGGVLGNKLLKAFGSIEGVRNATTADLLLVVRNKSTVEKIQKALAVS